MTRSAVSDLVEAQRIAVEEVKSFTNSSNQIKLINEAECNGCVEFNIEINTRGFYRRPGGLAVQLHERVTVLLGGGYPAVPPFAFVKHIRWAGFPHVIRGNRLCIYLDPGTEWDPTQGMQGFLLRLWEWFEDAVGGQFDPTTALYHPVGGVLHRTAGSPTMVAALSIPADISEERVVHRIGLRPRTDHRIDIAAWKAPYEPDLIPGLLVCLPEYLPFGGGQHLSDLLATVRQQLDRQQRRRLETNLRRLTRTLNDNSYLHVIIAVPNPARGLKDPKHLIGWRLRASSVGQALAEVRSDGSKAVNSKEPEVEWTYVDDQRPEVAMRRDVKRPVAAYAGSTVAVWGCGALGSWIAELLVRSDVRRVMLRDPGFVTKGLLVRQNYTEEDVGRPKAEALAERLALLADDCEFSFFASQAQTGLAEDVGRCDFIFDTTVNTAVNAALGQAQRDGNVNVPVIQAATDPQTATLGIVTVTAGTATPTTAELDQALSEKVACDPKLAPFRTFWDHDAHPPLNPAPGCSVPTFNGSCADAMGIAVSVVSAAAAALLRQIAGGYLLALPHSSFNVPALTPVSVSQQTDVLTKIARRNRADT